MNELGKDIQSSLLPTIRDNASSEEIIRILKQYRQLFDSMLRLNKIYAFEAEIGDEDNYLDIDTGGVVTLVGTAKRTLLLPPGIDTIDQIAHSKPTQVTAGIFKGFSFPIYAADNEELFFRQRVPKRWDGASDILFCACICLAAGEDVGDYFKFRLSWEHTAVGEIVSTSSNNVDTLVLCYFKAGLGSTKCIVCFFFRRFISFLHRRRNLLDIDVSSALLIVFFF